MALGVGVRLQAEQARLSWYDLPGRHPDVGASGRLGIVQGPRTDRPSGASRPMIFNRILPFLLLLPGVEQGPDDSPKAVVLKAARMFDGQSDALISNAMVIVEGKTIKSVGTNLPVPDGATVIDLGDATLSPGFIDAHTHLTHERSADYNQGFVDSMRREVPEAAILATVYARRTVEAGFTTVRDVGSGDFLDVGLRNSIAKGVVPGPRMLVCVHSLGATGGHADRNGLRHDLFGKEADETEGIANGPDRLRAAVRYQVKYGADVIKFCASGGVLSLADEVDTPQLTRAEMTALVDEAHRLRKKVACHCHGDQAARDAIGAGVDSIEHGSFLSSETLQMMKSQGTYLVPTLMAPDSLMPNLAKLPPEIAAKARAANASLARTFAEAVKLGVKIGFGTDSGVSKHGQNAREFRLMVGRGMTPIAALKAATSADAELLGLSKTIGTLEPGKLADIIAIPGDPVADITATEQVVFVMKEGKVVVKNRP
jgi:imidazolonepropionase-like amidohydrolase